MFLRRQILYNENEYKGKPKEAREMAANISKKRGLKLSLCMVLALLLVLSACSGGNDNKAPKENDGQAQGGGQQAGEGAGAEGNAPSPGTEPDGDHKIEITTWDAVNPDDMRKPFFDEVFAAFEKEHPNIIVKREAMPASVGDREIFVTSMAGGSGPDAYHYGHFPIMGDWIKQGFALDLTSRWEAFAGKDQYLPSSLEAGTYNGALYGVPNTMYIMGLVYNKKRFEEAGLDPNVAPETWDEFVEFGKKLTDKSKQQYGYALLGMEWADWFFEYYVWQAGGDLTTRHEDGTVTLDFTKDWTVQALQFYKDMKWKHEMVQNNVVQSMDDNVNDFFQGRAAMMLHSSEVFGGLVAGGMDLNEIGFAPYPKGPAGKNPAQMGGAYWLINPQSSKEKQDAAFTYITYMTSKEVVEKKLQFDMDNGVLPNLLTYRQDVDPSQFASSVSPDLVANVKRAAETTQLEYFLKERLGSYVTQAVQKVLTDANADPLTELRKAEELAQREVVDPYNAEMKG